jgi:hypothetical protein
MLALRTASASAQPQQHRSAAVSSGAVPPSAADGDSEVDDAGADGHAASCFALLHTAVECKAAQMQDGTLLQGALALVHGRSWNCTSSSTHARTSTSGCVTQP